MEAAGTKLPGSQLKYLDHRTRDTYNQQAILFTQMAQTSHEFVYDIGIDICDGELTTDFGSKIEGAVHETFSYGEAALVHSSPKDAGVRMDITMNRHSLFVCLLLLCVITQSTTPANNIFRYIITTSYCVRFKSLILLHTESNSIARSP